MDSITWHHPTGNRPRIVALLCLGPSREGYIGGQLARDLSDATTGVDEVWTLNRGGGAFRHDLLWVMDHIQGEADQHPRYGAALWRHDKPIITSDDADGWPAHVHRYPFALIWNWLRTTIQPIHGDWYHNSLAYILPYAAFIGVQELRVFGADYSHHSSGVVEDGHPCVAYWAGRLESAGLAVKPCDNSGFLNANQRDWIYGYRRDPRALARRARFRALAGLPADEEAASLLSGERQVAPALSLIQPDHVARYYWAAQRATGFVLDIGSGIGYGAAILADTPSIIHVLALDCSRESLEYGNHHYDRANLTRNLAELDGAPLLDVGPADCATAFEIIEHLADPRPLLRSLPCKRLFLSVPNEAVIPYSPETAPFHLRHYRADELETLLRDCGWRVVDCGWYGQTGPESPVIPLTEDCRTLIVEARRDGPMD